MLAILLYSVNDEARKEGLHDLFVVQSRLRHFQVQKRETDTLRAHWYWELVSGKICIVCIYPRISANFRAQATREKRISRKLIKHSASIHFTDVSSITNIIVLLLNEAFSIFRSFRYEYWSSITQLCLSQKRLIKATLYYSIF